jgi:inhibitor of KinA
MIQETPYPEIVFQGDSCLLVRFYKGIDSGQNQRVLDLEKKLRLANPKWLLEMVPSYGTLGIYYDPKHMDLKSCKTLIQTSIESNLEGEGNCAPRTLKIPVCYEEEFALDMTQVTKHTGIPKNEIIAKHSTPLYRVYMLGFMPGFPYLGGMNPKISTPRLKKPRLEVFAGAVGIADTQTGIYPLKSPGGWNIIGRTPIKLFDSSRNPSVLLRAGDLIQFSAIDLKTYTALSQGEILWDF